MFVSEPFFFVPAVQRPILILYKYIIASRCCNSADFNIIYIIGITKMAYI